MSTVETGPSIITDFYSEKAFVWPTGHRNTLETEAGAADRAESTARKRNEPTDAKGAEVSSPSLPEDLLRWNYEYRKHDEDLHQSHVQTDFS